MTGGGGGRTPRALTIAGSDSGGGAGIEADLKAFARCGVHGTCAITAITAQNTLGVTAIEPVRGEMVLAQVRAVLDDIGVDAVKVGMVGSGEAALAIAEALHLLPAGTPVVVDPVMVAESGARLGDEETVAALVEHVLPRASVVTPNLREARMLARADDGAPDESLLPPILALGPNAALVTGGHRKVAIDLLLRAGEESVIEIGGPRHDASATHGSGCTHSSALAAALALGHDLPAAARIAREVAAAAVRDGLVDIGEGRGPVDALGIAARRSSGR